MEVSFARQRVRKLLKHRFILVFHWWMTSTMKLSSFIHFLFSPRLMGQIFQHDRKSFQKFPNPIVFGIIRWENSLGSCRCLDKKFAFILYVTPKVTSENEYNDMREIYFCKYQIDWRHFRIEEMKKKLIFFDYRSKPLQIKNSSFTECLIIIV